MSRTKAPANTPNPTHTVEDYLMTMYVMERDQGEIIAARLAEMLNVSPATVAMTFKRMERDRWIVGKGHQGVHLTPTGQAAARSVIRRHMLTEWMLLRMLKVPLSQTHEEAHKIEHAISPELEERMRENLDNPQVCPHGNPLPGFEKVAAAWVALPDLKAGQSVIIRRIHEFAEDNRDLMKFMAENGIVPGAKAKIADVLPFNQTVTLVVSGKRVTIGFPAARYIFVETE